VSCAAMSSVSFPPLAARLLLRHHALQVTRAFFFARHYVEVDSALLVRHPGLEPHIDPLRVAVRERNDVASHDRYLITSPEFAMKKLLAGAHAEVGRIMQLGHVFRDGETTRRHRHEFTLLEWYRTPGTLHDVCQEAIALLRAMSQAPSLANFIAPQRRTMVEAAPLLGSVADACQELADIDLDTALRAMAEGDDQALVRDAHATGLSLPGGADFEDAFFAVMARVEERLPSQRLSVLSRWPAQMAVLARRCNDDPLYAERAEIYGAGLELCNAYDELTDPIEQGIRFIADNDHRQRLGKAALPIDQDLLVALSQLPACAGNALGFDRMLMVLTGASDIGAVLAHDD
jgi:elongation factor P--(R)-beta-lysine ligase